MVRLNIQTFGFGPLDVFMRHLVAQIFFIHAISPYYKLFIHETDVACHMVFTMMMWNFECF